MAVYAANCVLILSNNLQFSSKFPFPLLHSANNYNNKLVMNNGVANAVQNALMGLGMIEMTWISAFFIGAGCLALGWLIGGRRSSRAAPKSSKDAEINDGGRKKINRGKPPLEVEKLAEIIEDFKMVLVVRNDLKMGKGKIAAQCSHATLGLYKKILNRAPKSLNRWEMCGQVKVVVKIESEDDMLVLQERAKSLNLPTHVTIDAGRTQIAPNSRTVMAVLGPADLVDDVTGGLKLL
ncbi:PREDICTED: peptidyl-tRNA hydrolase 2, mitochondrial isoform X1 [Erythranthe guttata]|uniref:peptidyl-tRNA hydrolase 2, mitochondrial isoform X1 n=1 Tax=Erythranthe guttata TaxID=4155 RepID=UPI00064D76B3|nr:PREDICTED: peptidyl-tRNA hydrolase 2, mitochondrial isoform X1 [Erythranthe guttata]|eukprot:XP_012844119.1 PREDICTED: peptidyl-tRNA hydrolase 2, mitochondrial isoform X1 [Erythranthe guttata]